MQDNGTVTEVQTDPLDSWKCVSALLLSAATAVLYGKVSGGIFYPILLFFPAKRIIGGLLDNKLQIFFSGIIALLLFPILKGSEPLFMAKLQTLKAGNVCPPAVFSAACYGLLVLLFLVLFSIAALLGKLFPQKGLPQTVHKGVMFILFLLSLVLGLCAAAVGINYCNGKFIQLPGFLTGTIPAIAGIIGIAALWRISKLIYAPASTKQESNTLSERPNLKLADVAGMEVAKEQIRLRLIEPVKNPVQAKKYGLKAGGGVLLYGPPGTGKTFLARAVAGELNLPFYMITAADVFSKYVGESENKIKELFQNARKNPLSVVFIDEMEIIFAKRTSDIHEVTQKVISVILQELDGVDQNKNPILLLGATNTPWKIDEAFLRPGRFDILAFVDLPDEKARYQIIRSAFKQGTLKLEAGLLEYIARNTNSYSGADLNGLVTRIRQQAYNDKAQAYTKQLAYEILKQSSPATNREIVENIRRWEAERK